MLNHEAINEIKEVIKKLKYFNDMITSCNKKDDLLLRILCKQEVCNEIIRESNNIRNVLIKHDILSTRPSIDKVLHKFLQTAYALANPFITRYIKCEIDQFELLSLEFNLSKSLGVLIKLLENLVNQ